MVVSERKWTRARIERELRPFLEDREEWPTYREFQRAGLKPLRDAITHEGGAARWAKKMGVRHMRHPPGYAPIWIAKSPKRRA
jgi:hypothetical protein